MPLAPAPKPAAPAECRAGLAFIRNSRIRGGTDLQGRAQGRIGASDARAKRTLHRADQRRRSYRGHGSHRQTGGVVHGGVEKAQLLQDARTRSCSVSETMPIFRFLRCWRRTAVYLNGCVPLSRSISSCNAFLAKIGQAPGAATWRCRDTRPRTSDWCTLSKIDQLRRLHVHLGRAVQKAPAGRNIHNSRSPRWPLLCA